MTYIYERNVPMATRDGVTLRANIWRPAEGKAPTLLVRHPYDKEGSVSVGGSTTTMPSVLSLVNAGYAVVIQDVRGAFQSDGAFEPKINEIAMVSVVGNISVRRGIVMSTDMQNGITKILAEVPLAETFGYSTDLRSMTQGQGTFTMELSKYRPVPANIQTEVIAERKAELQPA